MSSPASSDPSARPGTALVTGPTAGIGKVFADRLAGRGYDLVLVARDRQRLDEEAARLRQAYGVDVEVLPADLTDRDQLGWVEARLVDAAKPITMLVNNGGFGLKGKFLSNDVEQEQALLDVHVVAPMRLTHAALKSMTAHGGGAIINVASVAAFLARGTYGAAKAYTVRLTDWAHYEYKDQGVAVMALCPGFVRTEFHERMDVGRDAVPTPLWLDADFVVDQALADLDAGKAISVPGARYKAIVGAARFVPTALVQRFQGMGRK